MTIRPAEIGDKGVFLGLESHGSIGTLMLQVGDDEQAYLHGDWRMLADIAEAFEHPSPPGTPLGLRGSSCPRFIERAQDPDGFGLSAARLSCGRVVQN